MGVNVANGHTGTWREGPQLVKVHGLCGGKTTADLHEPRPMGETEYGAVVTEARKGNSTIGTFRQAMSAATKLWWDALPNDGYRECIYESAKLDAPDWS